MKEDCCSFYVTGLIKANFLANKRQNIDVRLCVDEVTADFPPHTVSLLQLSV